MGIGSSIRKTRIIMGFKQVDVAREAGLAVSTLCDIEKERMCPSIKSIQRIAIALKTDPVSFFYDL